MNQSTGCYTIPTLKKVMAPVVKPGVATPAGFGSFRGKSSGRPVLRADFRSTDSGTVCYRTIVISPAQGILMDRMTWIAMLLMGCLAGCETLHNAGIPGLETYVKDKDAIAAPEYRERFQLDRDPVAFTWLLAHRVHNGMTVKEINEALGETGEEFSHSESMKRNTDGYQATDVGYRWGPDGKGRSVILFFREGHLVNFNPGEFSSGA